MPTATYYLDAATLPQATAVYLDANLTQCAPDRWYSDGVNVRQQVSCQLLPNALCPSCLPPCGSPISASGAEGIYKASFNTGSTLGALIIRFDPRNVPDGIRARFAGETTWYNKISSNVGPVLGFQAPSGRASFSGNSCACLPVGNRTLTIFQYNGSGFVNTGTSETIFIDRNTDCSAIGPDGPDFVTLVVPKTLATQNVVEIEAVGACGNTIWDINIACPVILTSYLRSNVASTLASACGLPTIRPYYFVSAQQSQNMSVVNVADFVYTDPSGEFALPDGFYRVSNGGGNVVIQVTNGIVVSKTNC